MRNNLAARLASAFDTAKHTKADLARASKVSAASVSDWFSGETKSLKAEPMIRAAAYLDVEPLWLATGEGPMRHHHDSAAQRVPAPQLSEPIPLSRWDLPLIDSARWAACSASERGYLQGVISATLADLESRRGKHEPTGRNSARA